jgi:hypothetical protein
MIAIVIFAEMLGYLNSSVLHNAESQSKALNISGKSLRTRIVGNSVVWLHSFPPSYKHPVVCVSFCTLVCRLNYCQGELDDLLIVKKEVIYLVCTNGCLLMQILTVW